MSNKWPQAGERCPQGVLPRVIFQTFALIKMLTDTHLVGKIFHVFSHSGSPRKANTSARLIHFCLSLSRNLPPYHTTAE